MRGTYRYWRDGAVQDVVEPWDWPGGPASGTLAGQRIVGGRAVLEVAADYADGICTRLRVTWRGAGDERAADLAEPADALLFPLLRAATGPLLLQLLAGPRTVVVPDLHDPQGPGFLAPLRSVRSAVLIDAATRHYRFHGGEYGEAGADCWLDPRGLLARYAWASPQGLWEARLDDDG